MNKVLYEIFLKLIKSYQANYTGDDKMSLEFMMGEIDKFKRPVLTDGDEVDYSEEMKDSFDGMDKRFKT